MLFIDANLLLYAFNSASPWHDAARDWLTSIQRDEDVAISEFILAELYGLLRNPAVLKHPLPAEEAGRSHPNLPPASALAAHRLPHRKPPAARRPLATRPRQRLRLPQTLRHPLRPHHDRAGREQIRDGKREGLVGAGISEGSESNRTRKTLKS